MHAADGAERRTGLLPVVLRAQSADAEFDVTVTSVVGAGVHQHPADALTISQRARQLGFSTTVGLIHDGTDQLRALDESQRNILEAIVAMGTSAFNFANYSLFQKSLAAGTPNDWHCRAGARYLYICEDGLVHWCSQQRGHPGIPLDAYDKPTVSPMAMGRPEPDESIGHGS